MRIGEVYWTVIDPIWEKVSIYDGPDVFEAQFAQLSPAQKALFASHWCQSKVRNCGLHQFFGNPTGVLAPEAVAGFREIGLSHCADILEEAMGFFGKPYPREREIRQEA